MKKLILVLVLGLLIIPKAVGAAELKGGDQYTLPAKESVAGNVYVGTGSASILGQVVGDLYVGAGSTVVSGQVTDDLVVVGGNTTITGHVGGDVRVLGGQVIIDGTVGGDVMVVGGALSVSGEVLGDVDFIGGMMTVAPSAVVGGDVTYRSDRRASISPDAYVGGEVLYDKTLAQKLGLQGAGEKNLKASLAALLGAWIFLKLLMLLFGALVIYWLLLEPLERVTKESLAHPWRSLSIGFATAVAVPVLCLILIITILGLPLAFLIGAAYLMLFTGAKLAAGPVLGAYADLKFNKRSNFRYNWWIVLGGTAGFFVLSYIPLVGWLVDIGLILIVFGAGLNLLYRRWRA